MHAPARSPFGYNGAQAFLVQGVSFFSEIPNPVELFFDRFLRTRERFYLKDHVYKGITVNDGTVDLRIGLEIVSDSFGRVEGILPPIWVLEEVFRNYGSIVFANIIVYRIKSLGSLLAVLK